jgi:cold shock CspA family protein
MEDAPEFSAAAPERTDDDSDDEADSRPPALTARFDAELRREAETAIRAFTAAFDAALDPAHGVEAREGLHRAASALMRAGARTIIVLERFGAMTAVASAPQPVPRLRDPSALSSAPDAAATAPGAAPILAGDVEGTVKWFRPEKRFGFIAVEGNGDVFVHAQALERSGVASLQPGQRVRLTIGPGAKGPQAEKVELV